MRAQTDGYNSGLMAQSFWFVEFKKVVQLIDGGKTKEEIKRACVDENIFGACKPYRAQRMFGYLINRASVMDEDLRRLFLIGDLGTQRIINLICALKLDKLFFDFVYEVYREKAWLGVDSLSFADFDIYFRDKALQSAEVAAWNESTIRHLRSNYTCFLTEGGLLSKENSAFKITVPILDYSLETYLKAHEGETVLKALTGVM